MAQHPMKVVLLDLDGTLTKSDGGIIGSVIKTFEEIGRPVPDAAELRRFIGPAIIESLRRNHVPAEDLDRAVDIYRSYYGDRAVFDDPNDEGRGVLEFKQGFNGYVEQMVGKFTLPVDKFRFGVSNLAHKLLHR